MRSPSWNITDSKIHYFRPDYSRLSHRLWPSKEMSHDYVCGRSVAETSSHGTLGLLRSAKCRDRLWPCWLIAKFQMRHRLLPGLQRACLISSSTTMLCLLRFVYCVHELFAPYCYVSTTSSIYMIEPGSTNNLGIYRQFISNTDMEKKISYTAHVLLALNAAESISKWRIGACTHKLLLCIWRLRISIW